MVSVPVEAVLDRQVQIAECFLRVDLEAPPYARFDFQQ